MQADLKQNMADYAAEVTNDMTKSGPKFLHARESMFQQKWVSY